MVLASHAYRPHECESILFLKTQKATFEVMRIVEAGKKTELQMKLSEVVKVSQLLLPLK